MYYYFDKSHTVSLPQKANAPIIADCLENLFGQSFRNIAYHNAENCITVGNCPAVPLQNTDYVLNITPNGTFIKGKDFRSTMHGFLSFLDKLHFSEEKHCLYAPCTTEQKTSETQFRCVHLCVFPETDLFFLRKCVRSCAYAKFTHIILEFWGMLDFDCLKELSWPFAYSKKEICKIIQDANALGVEIIPMFNHLGHASACREINGKHVVLDQNPQLEYLFSSYGWIWDITKPEVCALHKEIRNELITLCGDGAYFHLGCDEAYAYGHAPQKAENLARYLNEICEELKQIDRRPIIWHDMLLAANEFPGYVANAVSDISDVLLKDLDKSIIIADWQYDQHNETWQSSQKLKDAGFDVICCPWDNKQNIECALETVHKQDLFGYMQTTWHTLDHSFREMIYGGALSYGIHHDANADDVRRFYCAHVARCVTPSNRKYDQCGWSKKMIGVDF